MTTWNDQYRAKGRIKHFDNKRNKLDDGERKNSRPLFDVEPLVKANDKHAN